MNLPIRKTLSLLLLLATASALGFDLTERYQPGDVVRFAVERREKIVGTQEGTCLGWQVIESESLYVFEMRSEVLLEQAGKSFILEIVSRPAYYRDGRPRYYQYKMEPLGRKIEHEGTFTGRDYYGATTRFGVRQPFSHPTTERPLLFDTHFGLQWEIAAGSFDLQPGDSMQVEAIIPQSDQVALLDIVRGRDQRMTFDERQIETQIYSIEPANQRFYIDRQGRLLRAHDVKQLVTVERLPADSEVKIAGEPWLDTLSKRFPGYLLLLGFALAWLIAVALKRSFQPQVLLFFLIGAAAYWPALKLLTEIAILYEQGVASPAAPRTGSYIVVLGLAVIFALGEELTKFVLIWLRTLLRARISLLLAVAIGAACGAGFAFLQGTFLTTFAPDGSILLPIDLWQRFFVIGINAATGSLIALILVSGRPPAYFLIPFGVKVLQAWLFVFVQRGVFGLGFYALLAALLCFGALTILFLLYRVEAPRHAPRRARR